MTTESEFPADNNRRTVPSARRTHGGCRDPRKLPSAQLGAIILLNPCTAGCPAIVLDPHQATAIRDRLAEGLE